MPWDIVDGDSRCPSSEPWAVVKQADGELEGCHATKSKATDQVAAFNAAEDNSRADRDMEQRDAQPVDPDATTLDVDGQQVSLRTLAHSVDQARAEHRAATSFELTEVEVRASGAGNGQYTITGYASVTNRWYDLWPGVRERINAEAFDDVLGTDPDVHALWDHDTRFVLARTRNRTLDLSVDDRGFRFWARVADTSYGRDLRTLMDRGDIDQASFAFTVPEGGDSWHLTEEDGRSVISRTIHKIDGLFDVTVTAKGANPFTDSGVSRAAVRAALSDRTPRDMGAKVHSAATPSQPDELDGEDAPSPQHDELADESAESAEVREKAEHLQTRIHERKAALQTLKRRAEAFRND